MYISRRASLASHKVPAAYESIKPNRRSPRPCFDFFFPSIYKKNDTKVTQKVQKGRAMNFIACDLCGEESPVPEVCGEEPPVPEFCVEEPPVPEVCAEEPPAFGLAHMISVRISEVSLRYALKFLNHSPSAT